MLVFLVFGVFGLMACNLAYRALNELANGLVGGVRTFARGAWWTACTTWRASRILWALFVRLQITTAQRLYAWWYGYYWRWQRRYIARGLRARRAARHA